DGVAAVEAVARLRPDVVLADIRMPRLDGLELTRRLAGPGVATPTRVIVVTTFEIDEYVHTALRNGACGFLLKRSGPTLLIEAVRAAMAGDTLISPQVTVRLLDRLSAGANPPTRTTDPTPVDRADQPVADPLTVREHEIVRLIARGHTNAEIGAELYITAGTAKTHIANIQAKLRVRNRVGIAAWAWANGHVTPSG
ncbi:response regulator, partial [Streptomyces microflavus]